MDLQHTFSGDRTWPQVHWALYKIQLWGLIGIRLKRIVIFRIVMFHHTGLAGDNDLQNAEIGSIVDFIVDIGKSCENVMRETDEAKQVCIAIVHA